MSKELRFRHIKQCLICHQHQFKQWDITSYKHYFTIQPDLDNDLDPIKKHSKLYVKPITLTECQNCSFVFATPQLSSDSLSNIYNQNAGYFSHYVDETTPAMQMLIASYKVEIDNLEKLKPGGKLLEIGCNGGRFLSLLDNQWDITGLDIDKNAITAAKKRLGTRAKLIHAPLHKAKFSKGQFDVIVMRAVLEHVPDPRSFIKIANKLLKPGGLVAITVPNIGSPCGQLYKRYFRIVDPIHHIWYFSPKTLAMLLADYNFKIDTITYNYFNTPYFHFKDIFIFIKDWLLYQLTKQRPKHASPPFYGSLMDIYAHKIL